VTGLPATYSVDEVAATLRVSPRWLADQIRDRKVGCLRGTRKSVRLLDRHVQQVIDLMEQQPTASAADTGDAAATFGATRRSARRQRVTA